MAPDGESEGGQAEDRELRELLNELRYAALAPTARTAFVAALPTSGAAAVLLVTGSAYHRVVGKPYDKRRILRTPSHPAVTAIGLLGIVPAALAAGTWFVLPLGRRPRP